MSKFKRRQFLKLSAAGSLSAAVLSKTDAVFGLGSSANNQSSQPLPDIPKIDSMRSVVMTHKFGDLFNPPGLTNQWGCAQAAMDVTAVRSIAFPRCAQGEMNVAPLGSGGELLTGVLYVDGEYFASTKTLIDFVWQPDRIERHTQYRGLELSSVTIVPFKQMSVAVSLTIENKQKTRRQTEIKFALNGGVTKSVAPWNGAYSPGEFDNKRTVDTIRGAVLCKSVRTDAYSLQGAWPVATEVRPSWLIYRFDLAPGEKQSVTFVDALAESADEAQRNYDKLVRDFASNAAAVRDEWNAQLKAAFTPGNDRFSGYVPTLVTSDDSVRRLYHSAVL